MVLEQRRREQNGKRTTQAVAGQPDLPRHALAASRGDEPPTNAAPMSYRCRGEGRIRNVLAILAPCTTTYDHLRLPAHGEEVAAARLDTEYEPHAGRCVWQLADPCGVPVTRGWHCASAYTGLLYQELARNNAPVLDEHARLPAVLPVVLYNGAAPWKAEQEVGPAREDWTEDEAMSGETICRDPTWSRSWSGWSRAARSGISSR